MSDWESFRDSIKKVKNKRHYKISGSWGVYNAHRYTMKNKWFNIGKPVSSKEYYKIIRTVNKALVEDFLNGNPIVFPYALGELIAVKKDVKYFYINDKLIVTAPVNWNATVRLWFEDEEAYKNKTLVRNNIKENVSILFQQNKKNGLTNKSVLTFQPNRGFKEAVSNRVKEGTFFTYKLENE